MDFFQAPQLQLINSLKKSDLRLLHFGMGGTDSRLASPIPKDKRHSITNGWRDNGKQQTHAFWQ